MSSDRVYLTRLGKRFGLGTVPRVAGGAHQAIDMLEPLAADCERELGPAGGGRRACVGQSFAELETVLVLASIAQRYRLELTASGMPKPSAAITLRPGRLPMRLLPR